MSGLSWSDRLRRRLVLPVIASPMFLVSTPELVIAQCTAGVVGSFPALNARPAAELDVWLQRITEALSAWDVAHPDRPAAPYAVNLIAHRTNPRLEEDLATCVRWKTPIVITSLGAMPAVNAAVQAYGGVTLHDVVSDRFARKAVEKGASGLIAVAAGAGGHAGRQSPFALVQEIRQWFDGPLALSGAVAHGRSILAAEAMGADFAYVGSAFIATEEAGAHDDYKAMILASKADDIVYSDLFSGIHANYLSASIIRAGLDPANLPIREPGGFDSSAPKAWKDIWGCGQGVGAVTDMVSAQDRIAGLVQQYVEASADLERRIAIRAPA